MDGKRFDPDRACGANETRHEALGHFLRQRREAVAPAQVGILSHRGRRTPGLRREEVAFLADIGVKWYARLEAGEEIHPSEATLAGIAAALQLSSAEFEYVRDLASLRSPLPSVSRSGDADTGAYSGVTGQSPRSRGNDRRQNSYADSMERSGRCKSTGILGTRIR